MMEFYVVFCISYKHNAYLKFEHFPINENDPDIQHSLAVEELNPRPRVIAFVILNMRLWLISVLR
jgi:hypothetical protein